MIQAVVANDIRMRTAQIAPANLNALKSRLRFANPAYVNAIRLGLKARKIPRELECFDEIGLYMSIPRGAVKIVKELIPDVQFIDCRSTCKRLFLPRDIPLRDYQQEAVSAFCAKLQGYIV